MIFLTPCPAQRSKFNGIPFRFDEIELYSDFVSVNLPNIRFLISRNFSSFFFFKLFNEWKRKLKIECWRENIFENKEIAKQYGFIVWKRSEKKAFKEKTFLLELRHSEMKFHYLFILI